MYAGPTVLHFQDSRTISWSGLLQILSWHAAFDRIFIGTNSQALTSAQLNAITFVSPVGWPSGNYPATLLPSGELIPAGAQQADGYAFITTNGAAIITGYTGNGPTITIPGTIGGVPVIAIGDNAFSGANALTNVTIDSGIKIIGSSAFESCSNLISVTIPDSVIALGDSAFAECTSLTSAVVGNGSYVVPDAAFYDCSSLTNITLGSGVTNISDNAFDACASLTAINIHPLNPAYTSRAGVLFDKNMAILIRYPAGKGGTYSIPDNVMTIGDSAFYSCSNLTGVTFASTVTNIGNYAFAYCTTLASIIIPDHVINIGSYGFYECLGLSSIGLGSGLAVIDDNAFGYCTSLPTVTIPDNVTTVAWEAFEYCINLSAVSIGRGVTNLLGFYGCINLSEINVDPLNPSYSSVDGVLFDKSGTTLLEYPMGRSGNYTIPLMSLRSPVKPSMPAPN